ncbi:MAG: hypothetical protein LBJ31_03345 [Treponema sp.]|nr:hypothetical protein [Treponema sp.]
MKRFIVILFALTLPYLVFSQSLLEYEYGELCEDLLTYTHKPTIPYYTNAVKYQHAQDSYAIYVDDEYTFAILGPGYMKFQEPDGNIYYTRYLDLHKEEDGFYRGKDKYLGEIFSTEEMEGLFMAVAYLPKNGTRVVRERLFYVYMDDPEPRYVPLLPHHMNSSSIDPIYVTLRMAEILTILASEKPELADLYFFKRTILLKILDILIIDYKESERKIIAMKENGEKIRFEDFHKIHADYALVSELRRFLPLK